VPKILLDDPSSEDHKLQGGLELKDATFYYPTRPDKKILNNLSITFEKGKTTALVGPSGSGKSTVLQLLERFYDTPDADGGAVLVDGKDIKNIKLKSYRSQIGYVP
jgi:ABC-type multidrug transport system fused ATPase/permease subunit